ncbi:ribonuclease T [Natronospirillum operosum]|uniref:ribonuclease T n=1 Tax=Natronospirillum operosum TaxID=2759953 RepID=UPI00197CA0D5
MEGDVTDPNDQVIAHRFRGFLPVVVDVETAGFNARTDALLEISAVLLDMDEEGYIAPAEQLTYNVHPFEGANLEPAALEFTGIDPHHPEREAADEREAMTEVFRLIRREVKAQGCTRAVLVGHNANFDHGFVMAAAERIDAKRNPFHPFSSFDTASMAGLIYGQTVLAKACRAAGIPFDNADAHSAAYDALRTAELFCAMVNRLLEVGAWPPEGH